MPQTLDANALLTFSGLTIWTVGWCEVVLRAWRPSPDLQDRVGQLIAMAIAVVTTVLVGIYQGIDIVPGIIVGVLVGFTSMGVHDSTKVVVG